MSSREYKLTQTIADLATSVSAQTGLSIEESMNFVYNSENWDSIISHDDSDYASLESAILKEFKFG